MRDSRTRTLDERLTTLEERMRWILWLTIVNLGISVTLLGLGGFIRIAIP